ncbi:glycosyltransferase family 4 protein [Candidatus Parcubacteria bacterium]|nr:glycosyltransferase family 4 protein [Candidatus Parcubacteria bacterium]
MKILNVVVSKEIGGIQNRILMVAKKLNPDIKTIILTPKSKGDFLDIAKNEGFMVYQSFIESPKFFSSLKGVGKNILWFLYFPLAVKHIVKVTKKERIDIVHVNGLLALQAVVAARIVKKPIVWHLVSTIYPKSLVLLLRPFITRWANKIVFVTHKTVFYYLGKKYQKEKVKIIYEPVDTKYFDIKEVSEEKKTSVREEFGIPIDHKVVGVVGNITHQKGLEYFIRVANEVKKRSRLKIKFLIVGGKSKGHEDYYNKLQILIKKLHLENDIIFTGRVPYLQDVLSIMNIFLMTSIAEGTPLVILEAMAMGVPVVATDVGGISEQVADGETGIIVPPRDPNAISKAVIYLLEHPEERGRMGKKGRERVKKMFSLERCVEEHRKLYESV